MAQRPDTRTPLQLAMARKQALYNERSTWMEHWSEISRYQHPRSGRYFVQDRNKGRKKHNEILDNTPIFALRTLAAGMMSGMTSPARPWFRLGLRDKDLMEVETVKVWLHDVAEIMRSIFATSNTYNTLHTLYEELGAFGTASSLVMPDFDNVIHHYPMTAGEYMIATNYRGQVDTLVREFQMTCAQMVEQFGYDNCSSAVQTAWDRSNYDQWFDVTHMIAPRRDRDVRKLDDKNMPFASMYFEPGSNQGGNKFLRESGFKQFRALTPRWSVTGNDVYGQSPGMECLGDVKQLQHQQLRKGQAIDYQVNPPLQVPVRYKEAAKARLPGGVFYVDGVGQNAGVRSAFEVNLNLQHLGLDIEDVRGRIRSAYYADLFLMLANDTRSGITATEVAERHEEKLLMLGPVLERLHNELLSPLIDITFETASAAGILPPAPPELQGMDLNVEFISTLAQAQRAVASAGADRLLNVVGTIAAAKGDPTTWDKLDTDQIIDDYGDMFGARPKWIVPDERVAEMRAQRAQQQQMAQMAQMANSVADTTQKLGNAPTQAGDSNALTDVMNMFQGYNTPSPSQV
jgi:hypothetical protein